LCIAETADLSQVTLTKCIHNPTPSFNPYLPLMKTQPQSLPLNVRSNIFRFCATAVFLVVAVCSASAQTTRTWTGSTDNRYNDTANWNPTGAWANGDTLRFNGTQAGNLDLIYTGGQNTGVLLDFTAGQTGTVGIRLANEATQSRNFRLGDTNNTVAITVASGAGKVTLNGQSETYRMISVFGPNTDPGSAQTIFIDNAGTLEFGTFTTLSRAQTARNVNLILRQGGQTTILGRVNDFGAFGGIRVQGDSLLTLSGEWLANTRLMVDQGRADFTSAAAIGTNSGWNSIRLGNNVSTGVGTLRYTGAGDAEVGRRIQIGNGTISAQTGSAVIENMSATGRLVFTNTIFNADGADPLGTGNANTAAARTLTLGGSSTLSNEITGRILDNSTATGGTIGVIKNGAGRWVLSGSNSYTGGTTVSAGTLVLGHTNALSSGAVTVNGGTLDLNGLSVTANQLGGSGGAIALGGGALRVNNTSTTTNASAITGSGSLTKAGVGILVLAGNSTYTGDTLLEAGNIQLGLADALSTGSVLRFSANANDRRLQMQGFNQTLGGVDSTAATGGTLIVEAASDNVSNAPATLTLDVAAGQSHNFSGIVRNASGTAVNSALTLIKDGAGTQVLSGASVTYSGTTTINAGVLELAGANSVANNSAITLGSNGTVRFSGGGTRGNTIAGTGNLEKTGVNTLTLSGSNSYTGTTTVSAGSLIIGATGSVGGSSVLDVASGATLNVSAVTGGFVVGGSQTLKGSGTIVGNTTINGIHSPGNSAGVQTFASDLTYSGTPTVQWELTANTTTQASPTPVFDQIVVNGNLDFAVATTLTLNFALAESTVDWSSGLWANDITGASGWLVYDVAGSLSNFQNLSLSVENWADGDGVLLQSVWAGSSFSLYNDGISSDVYLNYAVPEPSTYALLALAAAGLGVHVVRRRRSLR
jgi:fibronectin-binding autotransporter adhesin